MCGIFGLAINSLDQYSDKEIKNKLYELFLLSEDRGKESSGIAIRTAGSIYVYKRPIAASKLVRDSEYNMLIDDILRSYRATKKDEGNQYFAAVGHARLVTNGLSGISYNNQPVIYDKIAGVHNGIVVNVDEIWQNNPHLKQQSDNDTEVILALTREGLDSGDSLQKTLKRVYGEIYGTASIALFIAEKPILALASNFGSLYYFMSKSQQVFSFASQHNFLLKAFGNSKSPWGEGNIKKVDPGQACIVDCSNLQTSTLDLQGVDTELEPEPKVTKLKQPDVIVDVIGQTEERLNRLRRCTRCILPETFPFITFDEQGVCNYCHSYQPIEYKGHDALVEMVEPFRSKDGSPDCIVPFSGGRDSSYVLHYIKVELGMNPVAYTYDWALVTDLARRNQSRLCAKLGVEHYLFSANIKKKRSFIRSNIKAWLKRPELGMVPLFMAGDKYYFYYAKKIQKISGVDLVLFGGNRLEKTNFKSGLCGIPDTSGWRVYDISMIRKVSLALYYLKQFMLNPNYFNSSLRDTLASFCISYFMKHDFNWFYDYILWDQDVIMQTLTAEYDWETATDTDNTWRIGDGTAAFYNYIYHTVAGFSEHDTFRSNQIREGLITREEGMTLVSMDNQPRFESIIEYSNVIGFDFDLALSVIDSIPKLY